MKRTAFILLLILASCSKNEVITVSDKSDHPFFSIESEVAKAAVDWFTLFHPSTKSDPNGNQVKEVLRVSSTVRSENLYAANFTKGGFAIVDYTPTKSRVLALIDNGDFDGVRPNSFLGYYLENYVSQIDPPTDPIFIEPPFRPTISIVDTLDHISTNVTPLLESHWYQGIPFNKYCPQIDGVRTQAGCAAIATGQIIAYHETPSVIPITFPGAHVSSFIPDWSNMKTHSLYGSETCIPCDMNGLFIRELGYKLCIQYGINVSTISPTAINLYLTDTFNSFGFSCDPIQDYYTDAIINDISSLNPVLIWGNGTNGHNGHMWVIDGCRYNYYKLGYYIQTPFHISGRELVATEEETTC